MSHIVTIETEVRDSAAVMAACRRLGLPESHHGKANLFSGTVAGMLVELPGWSYPAVCELATGQIRYDNYGGHWGDRVELDRFLQAYVVEKTKIEARRQRHTVLEQSLDDGSIKLTIQVGGHA